MLYTDGSVVTTSDLLAMEGEITIVADAQGITVQETIDAAHKEVGLWLLANMQRFSSGNDAVLNWHQSTFAAGFSEADSRPRVSLSQVVTTDAELPAFRTALADLCLYEALRMFYANASRMEGTDRYEEKRDYYTREIREKYRPRFLRTGLPYIGRPLPRPAAAWEPQTGGFAATDVTVIEDALALEGRTLDIAVSYVDAGQATNNESALSERVTKAVLTGFAPTVSIARLRPPTGGTKAASLPRVLVQSLTATHWNVYAGVSGGTLYLQNDEPIEIATTDYLLAADLATGTEAGVGQHAERYLAIPSVIMRG